MRLSELIEELLNIQEELGPDMDPEVMSSSDYGDIMHTEQLEHIVDVQMCIPLQEAYSRSGLSYPSAESLHIDDDDERFDEDDRNDWATLHSDKAVIALRYKRD